MNNSSTSNTKESSRRGAHLLDTIRAIREGVGDGLDDNELTHLLQQSALPTEAGFAFLSFWSGIVTLSVPRQDLGKWYPKEGLMRPEKEKIAVAIAERCGLLVGEPPDEASGFRFPRSKPVGIHHHFELRNQREAVIVAHPFYLKVRMFGARSDTGYSWVPETPLLLGPDLLQDLSALYQP